MIFIGLWWRYFAHGGILIPIGPKMASLTKCLSSFTFRFIKQRSDLPYRCIIKRKASVLHNGKSRVSDNTAENYDLPLMNIAVSITCRCTCNMNSGAVNYCLP
jgi:hypothetical protein